VIFSSLLGMHQKSAVLDAEAADNKSETEIYY